MLLRWGKYCRSRNHGRVGLFIIIADPMLPDTMCFNKIPLTAVLRHYTLRKTSNEQRNTNSIKAAAPCVHPTKSLRHPARHVRNACLLFAYSTHEPTPPSTRMEQSRLPSSTAVRSRTGLARTTHTSQLFISLATT